MESFYSTLKIECLHRQKLATRAQARAVTFEYLETFYNRERILSALGYKSPVDFEQQLNKTSRVTLPTPVRLSDTGSNCQPYPLVHREG